MRKVMAFSILVCLGLGMALSGCGPSPQQMRATETHIAGNIFATLTASIPTITLTPIASVTPTITPFPTLTSQPLPQTSVKSMVLNLREGPDLSYAVLQGLQNGDQLSILGQYQNCTWLKVSLQNGTKGWVYGNPSYVDLPPDCSTIPDGTFRPLNGMLIQDKRGGQGANQMKVDNGTAQDSVIVMVKADNSLLVAFYVRTKEQFVLFGVPNGKIQVYFSTGSDWNGNQKKFLTGPVFSLLDSPLNFITTGDIGAQWNVSLVSGLGSPTPSSEIDPDKFPLIK
jgi:hypothetical protein